MNTSQNIDLSCVKLNRGVFAYHELENELQNLRRYAKAEIEKRDQVIKHLHHVAGGHKAYKTKIKRKK